MQKTDNILNKKFERLTVLEEVGKNKHRQRLYKCLCSCGNVTTVVRTKLLQKQTRSCGCLQKETSRATGIKNRLPDGEAGLNAILHKLKTRARLKKRSLSLTEKEIIKLINESCYYCSSLPYAISKVSYSSGSYVYTGIDRIDNSKGYDKDNVLPCCGFCNKLRGHILSVEETVEVVKLLKVLRNKENIWEDVC